MVRKELRAALSKEGFALIPLLVNGARMPAPDAIPDDLRRLVWRNALALPDDPFWRPAMETLIAAIGEVLSRGADVPELSVAVEALERGDNKAAHRRLTQILKEHTTAEAYYYRGFASYAADNFKAAVDDWDVAAHLAPRWAVVYRQRANALSAMGMTDRALADYERAIALEPQDPRAYMNRALLYESVGNLSAAAADLEAAVRLHFDPALIEEARQRLKGLRARLGAGTA
jgi:tetratricopeptide (TPR) repeat protein